MQDLRAALIQSDLAWEEIDANISNFDCKINSIGEKTDIILLPEMFTTGFTMNAERVSQGMDGSAVAWMKKKSAETNAHITGSLIIQDGGNFYNRLIWAMPGGKIHTYDKKHLFRYAGEDATYTPGTAGITVEIKGWRIRPFICYDLRFPLWTRNMNNQYDAALFIASWPESRSLHWKSLLAARAIENQCYVIGVNRVGTDGNGIRYSGDSAVINYRGEVMYISHDNETIHTFTLSHGELADYRKNFPFWKDADVDMLKL